MKTSDQIPEQIDDDAELAPLKHHFSIAPPVELDQKVKHSFQSAFSETDQTKSARPSIKDTWNQQLQTCWQLSRQAPAMSAGLLIVSLFTGIISGLNWRTEQQPIAPSETKLILRNGNLPALPRNIANNAQLPSEQWLEIIAELLVQQRVEEANKQLQAYRTHHSTQNSK